MKKGQVMGRAARRLVACGLLLALSSCSSRATSVRVEGSPSTGGDAAGASGGVGAATTADTTQPQPPAPQPPGPDTAAVAIGSTAPTTATAPPSSAPTIRAYRHSRTGPWTTYGGPMSWSIDYPDGWHVQDYGPVCHIEIAGTIVTNYDVELPVSQTSSCSPASGLAGLPADFTSVEIGFSPGRLAAVPPDPEDTRLPLHLSDLGPSMAIAGGFTQSTRSLTLHRLGGYFIIVRTGPAVSADDQRRLEQMVETAFERVTTPATARVTNPVAVPASTPTTAPQATTSTTRPGRDCGGPPGSATDLGADPAYGGAPGESFHRFVDRDGCAVRLDVLQMIEFGPDFHCAPWPTGISFGTPLGTPATGQSARSYVRQPPDRKWIDPRAPDGYASPAALPATAADTGYSVDGSHLWTSPDTDAYIWLVGPAGTERWPRAASLGCI